MTLVPLLVAAFILGALTRWALGIEALVVLLALAWQGRQERRAPWL